MRKIILTLTAVAAAAILSIAGDAFASDLAGGPTVSGNDHFVRSDQGCRFSMKEMVNQAAAAYNFPGSAAGSSTRFGLRRLHKYLGYGTLIFAAATAVSGSESDLHCGAAYAATGTAMATCVTGFMKYHRRWNPGKGLFRDDNAHIMLGVIGGIGMVASVITADSDSGPGHAGVGASGGALMAVSVILIKW
ncbi:MAG: hypothetical protein MUF59_10255 [Candidatus Krumholzibacteria bacterium]|nr:hypothetical protein [Candidatus Krumholzibacteria bacterium]